VVTLQGEYADTIRALTSDTIPTIIVASTAVGALARFTPARRAAPWDPWMATALLTIAQDTTLASTAPGVLARTDGRIDGRTGTGADMRTNAAADSIFGASVVVLARTTSGTPIIVAAATRDDDGPPQLFIISRAPATHVHTAALLLAATSVFAQPTSTASTVDTTSSARGAAWRALQRAPSLRTSVNALALVDVESPASRGRYVWVAVLLLLGVEWLVRRYSAWRSAAATPSGER